MFGFAAGLFFFSYLLFEIPSNLLLEKLGARIWLSRICITTGRCRHADGIHNRRQIVLRAALPARDFAEAGFAPGSVYLINLWAPKRYRAKSVVVSALAIPFSVIIGGPIAGLVLSLDHVAGLAGWQWLYLVEGLPSILFGIFTLRFLTDRPEQARWLSDAQRAWLADDQAKDTTESATHGIATLRTAVASARVWRTGIAFFCVTLTTYGMGFWMPQIVKQMSGLSNLEVSLSTTIPFIGLAVGFVVNSWHSDRAQEREWHFVGGALIGALGLMISSIVPLPSVAFAGLVLTGFGLGCALGVLFTIPMGFLSGPPPRPAGSP